MCYIIYLSIMAIKKIACVHNRIAKDPGDYVHICEECGEWENINESQIERGVRLDGIILNGNLWEGNEIYLWNPIK